MKALAYYNAHSLDEFQFEMIEVKEPPLGPLDVLVNIKAFAINPVDTKVRISRTYEDNRPVILGWDAAGVIERVGLDVKNFKVGDEVFYAGDLNRDGAYAEKQAVDSRLIALKPKNITFAEAAALPLTSLTAWEGLFDRGIHFGKESTVLIIGGAGGVGSVATQILRAKTAAKIITTASRQESVAWSLKMGAHAVIDHAKGLAQELNQIGVSEVDVVFSTTQTEQYIDSFKEIIRPFGHFIVIDDPKELDILGLKMKAISTHWEFMFAKSMWHYNMESQGEILSQVSKLVAEGKMQPTKNSVLNGLILNNIKMAHELIESGRSIGKIVVQR